MYVCMYVSFAQATFHGVFVSTSFIIIWLKIIFMGFLKKKKKKKKEEEKEMEKEEEKKEEKKK